MATGTATTNLSIRKRYTYILRKFIYPLADLRILSRARILLQYTLIV